MNLICKRSSLFGSDSDGLYRSLDKPIKFIKEQTYSATITDGSSVPQLGLVTPKLPIRFSIITVFYEDTSFDFYYVDDPELQGKLVGNYIYDYFYTPEEARQVQINKIIK